MVTTSPVRAPATYRVPIAVRGAQALLLLPLGALQLVAATAFLITDGVHGVRDCLVAAWVLLMAPCCVLLALQLGRRQAGLLRAALLLLTAESALTVVKLTVYDESAALVFLAFIAACAGLLVLPPSRRHFVG